MATIPPADKGFLAMVDAMADKKNKHPSEVLARTITEGYARGAIEPDGRMDVAPGRVTVQPGVDWNAFDEVLEREIHGEANRGPYVNRGRVPARLGSDENPFPCISTAAAMRRRPVRATSDDTLSLYSQGDPDLDAEIEEGIANAIAEANPSFGRHFNDLLPSSNVFDKFRADGAVKPPSFTEGPYTNPFLTERQLNNPAPKPSKWNPALLLTKDGGNTSLEGPEEYIEEHSQDLGIAVITDDRVTVEELLKKGAMPMTRILDSSFAVDVAVELSHIATLAALLADPNNLDQVGLRCLLTAVVKNKLDVVLILLDLGMRDKLDEDEEMKLIFWGWTCKHGTPDMLETLHVYGPPFSWKAYWHWCLFLTDDISNAEKIIELRDAYFQREKAKRSSFMRREDILDLRPEGMDVPELFVLMRTYMEDHPDVCIDDYYLSEFLAIKTRPVPKYKPIGRPPWTIR